MYVSNIYQGLWLWRPDSVQSKDHDWTEGRKRRRERGMLCIHPGQLGPQWKRRCSSSLWAPESQRRLARRTLHNTRYRHLAQGSTVHDGLLHPHLRHCSSPASAVRRQPSAVRTATPAFHVQSAWNSWDHARSVTFLWQFSPGPENFSFLILLAYTAH